jgi:hypothetical protein
MLIQRIFWIFLALFIHLSFTALSSEFSITNHTNSALTVDISGDTCTNRFTLQFNETKNYSSGSCCLKKLLVSAITGALAGQEVNTELISCGADKLTVFASGKNEMGLSPEDPKRSLIRCTKCQ